MISQYPYIVARYIAGFIRIQGDGVASNKPDSFMVRQFAALVMRVYMAQIIATLNAIVGETVNLKSALQTTLTSISIEYDTRNFQTYYNDVMTLSAGNTEVQEEMHVLNNRMTASKSNLEKAVMNEQRANTEVSRAKLLMYIWLALLIVLLIAVVGFYFIGTAENNMFYYMYILCGIFVVAVFINAMVQAARSTSS
jgi:hypothetical protein